MNSSLAIFNVANGHYKNEDKVHNFWQQQGLIIEFEHNSLNSLVITIAEK